MIKKILSDSFLYTIATTLTKGINFIMIPIYTAYFSTAEYGVIDLIMITGSILSIIIGLEIHQAVARFFPEAHTQQDKKAIVSSALWAIILFFILFIIVITPFLSQISIFAFDSIKYTDIIFVALLSYGFNFIYYYFSSQLKWQLKSKQSVITSFIYALLTALLTYILLKFYNLGITSVFLAQIIAAIFSTLLSFLYSKEYYGFIFKLHIFKSLLKFSTPLIFSTLVVYGMLYVDRLMINYYLSIEDVGLYGIATRFASVTTLFTVGIQTALTPLIYNSHQDPRTPPSIAKLFNYFMLAGIVFITVLFIFSKEIILAFANESYINAHTSIPWIAIALIFSGIINFAPGIFIAKKTTYILYINLIAFILNIVLNLFFIVKFGLIGAAYSTATSSFVYFLLYYYVGQKYYYIPYNWIYFTKKR